MRKLALLASSLLALATPAAALTPAQKVAASGGACNSVYLNLNFLGVANCFKGQAYASPTTLPTWSFSRASTKTAFDASGVLHTYASNVPAINSAGLLLEPAATNLALYSATTSNADWVTGNASLVSGYPDPAGGTTAGLATANGASGTHSITVSNNATSYANSTVYTISYLVKPVSITYLQIFGPGAIFNGSNYANFQLTGNGSVTASSNVTPSISYVGGGWYLIAITLTSTSAGTSYAGNLLFILTGTDARAPSNTSTGSFYVDYAQVEAASSPSSRIITTSAAATRAADVASVSLPIPANGTMVEKFTAPPNINSNTYRAFGWAVGLDSTNNRLNLRANDVGPTPNVPNLIVGTGSATASVIASATYTSGRAKVAASWGAASTYAGLSVNGATTVSTAANWSPATTGAQTLTIGGAGSGNQINTTIQSLKLLSTQYEGAALSALSALP